MKVNIGPYPGLRSKKERKIDIRIDRYDSWSMDSTLALIIHPLLIQLKETKHGIPSEMFDIVGVEWEKHTDEEFQRCIDKWDEIMDIMIDAFYKIIHDENEPFDAPYYVENKAYNDRIQEGCELFGRYFRDLWD